MPVPSAMRCHQTVYNKAETFLHSPEDRRCSGHRSSLANIADVGEIIASKHTQFSSADSLVLCNHVAGHACPSSPLQTALIYWCSWCRSIVRHLKLAATLHFGLILAFKGAIICVSNSKTGRILLLPANAKKALL